MEKNKKIVFLTIILMLSTQVFSAITLASDNYSEENISDMNQESEKNSCNCYSGQNSNEEIQKTYFNNPSIDEINKKIKEKGENWIAGENSITQLSPEEQAGLCGLIEDDEEYPLTTSTSPISSGESQILENIPKFFDWRNKNGQNYITSIKNQAGCGSCWAFGTVALFEGAIQAYYNKPDLNIDLSEQDLVSCSGAGSSSGGCYGGEIGPALNYIKNNGLTTEACFEYEAENGDCSDKCDYWEQVSWSFDSFAGSDGDGIDLLKSLLITKGPLLTSLLVYGNFFAYDGGIYEHAPNDGIPHAVIIVGYGELNGVNYWICKNSWGTNWGETKDFEPYHANEGDGGWFRIKMYSCNIANAHVRYIDGVPIQPESENIQVECTDKDNDGYYYWGTGPKPDHCPPCPDIPDCNDNDPTIFQRCGFGYTGNPYIPNTPYPLDGSTFVNVNTDLRWTGGDINNPLSDDPEFNNLITYEIYLGTESSPTTLIDTIGSFPADQYEITYQLNEELNYYETYYWKIISYDDQDDSSEGPVWSFTTEDYSDYEINQESGEYETGIILNRVFNIYKNAQSFKPSVNVLSKIQLYLRKSGMPFEDLEMIICDDSSGEPDITNSLVSVSKKPLEIDNSYSWIEFNFNDIFVKPGETYYIILKTSGGSGHNYYLWGRSDSDVYEYGAHWTYTQVVDRWQGPITRGDYSFKTFGLTDNSENGLDQEQTQFKSEMMIHGTAKVAQSFKPSHDQLARVKLLIKKVGNPNNIIVNIRNSLYGDNLTSITISSSEIFDFFEIVEFDIPDIFVNPGSLYYIVVSAEGGDIDNYYKIGSGDETKYTNGILYQYVKSMWNPYEMKDLWFKTYSANNEPGPYELTVNTQGNGSVIITPDQPEYEPGTIVELTAIPDSGNAFYQWYGDKSGSTTTLEITMNSDKTVTAHFILIGDADQLGTVNSGDITKVELMIMDQIPETPEADANQDGRVDSGDITAIEKIILDNP